jgi:ankyrin repeat protein
MIGLWNTRWLRFGCVGVIGLALVAALLGWVWWMRISPLKPVMAGDIVGLKARMFLGASPTAWRGEDGATLLFRAVQSDKREMIEYLISQGADPNRDGRGQESPLRWAIGYGIPDVRDGASAETVATLLRCGADPNAPDELGDTPLIQAAMAGRADLVPMLIEAGADPSVPGRDGQSPLFRAVWTRKPESARVLLDHGADLEAEASDKPLPTEAGGPSAGGATTAQTPLTAAIWTADAGMVRLLLEHGADPNHAPKGLCRPIVWAVMQGHVEIVEALLQYKADPDPGAEGIFGPLHMAVQAGNAPLVEALLKGGADPNAVGTGLWLDHGVRETPLDLASDPAIVEMLESYGATERSTTGGWLRWFGG